MESLHTLMKLTRDKYKDWQKQNPYDHPAKLHRIMAEEIVALAKQRHILHLSLSRPVFSGGVPEYSQAVAALREADIQVYEEGSQDHKLAELHELGQLIESAPAIAKTPIIDAKKARLEAINRAIENENKGKK